MTSGVASTAAKAIDGARIARPCGMTANLSARNRRTGNGAEPEWPLSRWKGESRWRSVVKTSVATPVLSNPMERWYTWLSTPPMAGGKRCVSSRTRKVTSPRAAPGRRVGQTNVSPPSATQTVTADGTPGQARRTLGRQLRGATRGRETLESALAEQRIRPQRFLQRARVGCAQALPMCMEPGQGCRRPAGALLRCGGAAETTQADSTAFRRTPWLLGQTGS